MTAVLDVSYPADTVSEVGRSCAVETAERQYTEAESYTVKKLPSNLRLTAFFASRQP